MKSHKCWDFACHGIIWITLSFQKPNKAYHQVVQLYEGYVMEYHSKEDSIIMGRGQMGWGHFHANNSFLSCSRSSILREHFGGQIIPSCSRCIFYTLFKGPYIGVCMHDRWPTTIKVATKFTNPPSLLSLVRRISSLINTSNYYLLLTHPYTWHFGVNQLIW